ncbi:MAG TPA: HIT family protein [Acidimicrobiales bacterium]|nr:HIT family protein [Acidimicrobiales bacterium]
MPTLFTKIIDGDLPGRFLWRDEVAVAFMTISPIQAGHALIVPRVEVDNWLDLDADTSAHLMGVARTIGRAQRAAFGRERVGLIIAGLEVPHVHLHTIPITSEADLDFAKADPSPAPDDLDAAAAAIRKALRDADERYVADA